MNMTPVKHQPKPVTLEAKKTALIVLDQNQQVEEPGSHGHTLIPGLTKLLAKAREAGLYIIFTVPLVLKGTPHEQVYSGYKRKATEPLIYPDGYESKYNMSSDDFYTKYNKGELGDRRDFVMWAGYYVIAVRSGLRNLVPA